MRDLFRPVLFMTVVILIPVLPFLLFGAQLESWAESWRDEPQARGWTAGLVFALLASDIFLPVPASAVSTLGGSQLGAVWGTLISWAGMSVGAAAGFGLARRYGSRFARWFSKEEDLDRIDALTQRYGPATLLITRGVPVLAEASVLMLGMHRLSWSRFLPPVLLANLVLSVAYAVFGNEAQKHEWLPLALGVSIGLPVLLAAIAMRWLPKEEPEEEGEAEDKRE
ncbi:TVP38/TMEM64 family protein [Lignipirellula cremea]|uniref:TVP38/TMEM64 family membrane protein n=1 Tax=Lignipirellula cremea TaxID=2528010 RepID=A0A518E515_9BACT|nr:VTT domain-containing protein [Lignipirellula cremea]QDU99153.1 TVP38/TMEM64 family inner membrane protein YdjZ [Lignipirellula cremea]